MIVIDTTAFESASTLIIDIEVGSEKAYGAFHLLDADHKLTFDAVHKTSRRNPPFGIARHRLVGS